MNEIRIYWGYEFYPDEFNYPSIVGGWINDYIGGVSMALVILDSLPFKSYVERGFKASSYEPHVQPRGDTFRSPLYTLLGEPQIPDEFKVHFDILSTHEITWKYGRLLANSNSEFQKYWDRYADRRVSIFKKDYSSTFEELLISIKYRYQTTQFYPCDSMISSFHPSNFFEMNICDPYIDPNPKFACMSRYNETAYKFKETFSIRFTNKDEFTKKRSALLSKEAQRSTKSEDLNNLLIGSLDEVCYPSDQFDPQEQYFNPIGIGRCTALLNWGKGFPEMYPQFQDALINEKREIFGRFLSINELNFIAKYKITRNLIKTILDHNINYDLCSTLEYLLTNIIEERPPKKPPPKPVEPDEEDEYLIDMPDLFEDGIPKLWNYRHDEKSYRFSCEDAKYHTGRLCSLIIILTFPHLYTDKDRSYELDKYASESHISRAILSQSGLRKIMEPEDFFCDGMNADELGFNLFDEG
jgi:hypothetical protein